MTSPAEILDSAAAHIEKYGWVREEFYDDRPPGVVGAYVPLPPMECKVCPRGAVSVACGRHPLFTDEPTEWAELPLVNAPSGDYDEDLAEGDLEVLERIRGAEGALAQHLRTLPGYVDPTSDVEWLDDLDLIVDWNDAAGRTEAEVIAALRAAAQEQREAGR